MSNKLLFVFHKALARVPKGAANPVNLIRLPALPAALIALSTSAVLLVAAPCAYAQTDAVEDIENLFSKDEVEPAAPVEKPSAAPGGDANAGANGEKAPAVPEQKEIKDVSDLGKLQAFKDIAVIQRRFMPKSQRWEIYLAPTLNLNDAFFLNLGGALRFGYYFSERYGIESSVSFLSVSPRQVTQDLYDKRGVKTQSFVSARGYYGLDFKWVPFYGKMTFENRHITPFDLYFSFGGGLTPTNQDESAPTAHIGTGQIFAVSKSNAFRWDFSWYSYLASSKVDVPSGNGSAPTTGRGAASIYHNLMITMGWSFFFPEATYR